MTDYTKQRQQAQRRALQQLRRSHLKAWKNARTRISDNNPGFSSAQITLRTYSVMRTKFLEEYRNLYAEELSKLGMKAAY